MDDNTHASAMWPSIRPFVAPRATEKRAVMVWTPPYERNIVPNYVALFHERRVLTCLVQGWKSSGVLVVAFPKVRRHEGSPGMEFFGI